MSPEVNRAPSERQARTSLGEVRSGDLTGIGREMAVHRRLASLREAARNSQPDATPSPVSDIPTFMSYGEGVDPKGNFPMRGPVDFGEAAPSVVLATEAPATQATSQRVEIPVKTGKRPLW